MTLQEKELLTRFLQQLIAAQAGQKDSEADALIREAVARQPDAAYLLVQRAMQLEQLLQSSQAEVQKLQAQINEAGEGSAGPSGGFLSDPNAWGRSGAPRVPAPTVQQAAAAPAAAPAAASSWGSGLFGNIATTAAGVVAGSFLFQGIQGLMHHGETKQADVNPQVDPALASEPELLNSYDTAAGGELSDSFADSGGSGGDFG
jgi:hypothetical protein